MTVYCERNCIGVVHYGKHSRFICSWSFGWFANKEESNGSLIYSVLQLEAYVPASFAATSLEAFLESNTFELVEIHSNLHTFCFRSH